MTYIATLLLALISACCLDGGAAIKDAGQGRAYTLRRFSSQKEDPSALTPWTPPPDYALKTTGHKTMYLADVSIGVNGQHLRLLVDTGSPLVIVPGASCKKCTHHFETSEAKSANRTASVKFGLGSVSGHVFEDQVCLQTPGGSAQLTEVGFLQRNLRTQRANAREALAERSFDGDGACAKMSFVVADQESDDFAEQPFDGILGLGLESSSDISASTGGGLFSFLSQVSKEGSSHGTTFALRLSSSGASQLLLGDVDESTFAGGRAVWVPLSPAADGYWQFSVQDLTLDEQEQHFGEFQVAVDSGTSLLAADRDTGNWFREHLLPKDCNDVDHLPKLGLRVRGGSILSLLPADYIDQTDGKCNLALMPSELQSVGGQRLVLGDSFLRRYTTIFDRQNLRLGFGVAADESMANEMLPAMFPTQTTTAPPSTTAGPPPPAHLDYAQSEYVPVTTRPPPTAAELEAARTDADLNSAFSGLGEDLAGSFEHTIAREKTALEPSNLSSPREAATDDSAVVSEHVGTLSDGASQSRDVGATSEQGGDAGNPYLSFLK